MPANKILARKQLTKREYFYDEATYRIPTYLAWLHRLITVFLLVIIGIFVISLDSHANEINAHLHSTPVKLDNIKQGSLLVITDNPSQYNEVPLLHTDVNINISGMIMRSRLRQKFKKITTPG